jgi:Lon protease-like protein
MQTTIPIFPLNTVLFPGAMLPLRIFEQRYLEMVKICLRDGTGFGVCLIREGTEVGTPAVPEDIGCTCLIAQWDMPHLGLFQLTGRGERPFRIVEFSTRPDGLIRAQVEFLPDAAGQPDPAVAALCRQVVEQIVERLGRQYFPPPLDLDDPRWLSYRLAEVLPLELGEKQALLEERTDAERLRRVHEALTRPAL